MNGKKRLGWLALALCTLGTLALTALPGEPAAVPAMKLEPVALLVRPGELFLDGVRIPELRTSPDGSRTYAPAAEVLAALDPDFWAGEELEYQALSSEGRDWLFGVLLGVPNYFSSRFLLQALGTVPASVAYPVFSCGTILLTALVGRLAFGERPGRRQLAALAVVLVALVLLNG